MITWFLKVLGNDHFHVTGTQIDETIDGPKLMGMLSSKGLSQADIQQILWDLSMKEVGFTMPIAFNDQNMPKAS